MPADDTGNRVALAHRELGGDGDPPVVILHGLLGSSRNWQTAGRELAPLGRVFALDLRNHGASPHAPTMSYEALVADVLGWMDGQGIARARFVGHSMGGKAAMLVACAHPQRVDRLVVVDIAPRAYGASAHRAEISAMEELDLANLKSRAEAEALMEPRIPAWAMRRFLLTNLERTDTGWAWTVNLPVIARSLPAIESNPIAEGMRFEGPTLFVAGAQSRYIRPEDHAAILEHFPRARIESIAGAGHNPHVEAKDAFVRAVLAT